VVAELSLQIAGGPDAPSDARTALRRLYPEVPPDVMQVLALLASELVANAVTHAGAESIGLRFQVLPETIRVEVADEGPGFAPNPGELDPSAVGGWGLYLVDQLSSRWGVIDGEGARVWFEIER
jgi:anti-sigma regulatory factor (Ser/Thr protein kinase)